MLSVYTFVSALGKQIGFKSLQLWSVLGVAYRIEPILLPYDATLISRKHLATAPIAKDLFKTEAVNCRAPF